MNARPEIMGIGGICVDRIAMTDRIPEWDEVGHVDSLTLQQGGMVATAISTVARLGGSAGFIGGVGDDNDGRFAVSELQMAGICIDQIEVFPNETTASSFIFVHKTTGKRTIIHNKGAQQINRLQSQNFYLQGVHFIHMDGYWFETALEIVSIAKDKGVIVTIDPSSNLLKNPDSYKLLAMADYLIPGYNMAVNLSGETDPMKAARKLIKNGSKAVIVTKGDEGCFVCTDSESFHIPAFQIKEVNTTGAGDVFHGAFVFGLSRNYGLHKSLQFASAVAAIKCSKPADQYGVPDFAETCQFLQKHGITIED